MNARFVPPVIVRRYARSQRSPLEGFILRRSAFATTSRKGNADEPDAEHGCCGADAGCAVVVTPGCGFAATVHELRWNCERRALDSAQCAQCLIDLRAVGLRRRRSLSFGTSRLEIRRIVPDLCGSHRRRLPSRGIRVHPRFICVYPRYRFLRSNPPPALGELEANGRSSPRMVRISLAGTSRIELSRPDRQARSSARIPPVGQQAKALRGDVVPLHRHGERVILVQPIVALPDLLRCEFPVDIGFRACRIGQRGIVEALGIVSRTAHDGGGPFQPRRLEPRSACSTGDASRQRATITASSSAMLAPCARNGSVGCAASPSRQTRPWAKCGNGSRPSSAHLYGVSMLRMIVCTSSCQRPRSRAHSSRVPAIVHDSTCQSLRSTAPTKFRISPRRNG